MLTADATPATVTRLNAAGATAVLVKPINVRIFFEHLDQYLSEPA